MAVLTPFPAFVIEVNINPAAYTGNPKWWNTTYGSATADLEPGDYAMIIARYPNIYFNVDASGIVTIANDSHGSASGGQRK